MQRNQQKRWSTQHGFLLWSPPSNAGFDLPIGSVHPDTIRRDCGRTRKGNAEETLTNRSQMPSFYTEGLEQEGQVVAFCMEKHLRTSNARTFLQIRNGEHEAILEFLVFYCEYSVYIVETRLSWNKIPVVMLQTASIMWKNLLIISSMLKVTV